jgi:hypothetical protein
MVVCRKASGEDCAVCDFIDALYNTKQKEDESLAKRMGASSRYYFNVIDRSVEEGDEGYGEVLVYGAGTTVFQDILGIIVDPDYGDITDPEKGYDIIITKSGSGLKTEYKTNARPKQTPIGVDGWESKLIDLSIFAKPKSNDDLEKILYGEEPSDEKESTSTNSSSNTSSSSASSSSKPKDDNPSTDIPEGGDEIEQEIAAMLQKHGK